MNLTAQKAAALKLAPGQTDRIEFDDAIPGFGLRLRGGGGRSWIFQYKLGSKQRRLVLGKASAISAGAARDIASRLHAKVKLGGDPAAEKATGKARAADTFGSLATKYLDFQKDNIRERSLVEVTRHLNVHAKALHALPVTTVDQRTIADRLNAVAKVSGAVAANRTRASLSAMFGWAMREGLAPANPVVNTNKREEATRDRVLSDAELRTIWHSLEDDHYGAIIKLLMLTGQRANEIAALRWEEIDFAGDLIRLPAERTKNGRAHDVPMAGTVRALLKSQNKVEDRPHVFGYRGGPFSGWSKSKAALDKRIAEGAAIPHWTPHDLRRTAATGMAEIGVQPHIIEAVLNHVSGHKGGIAGIYNRAQYGSEKAQALARWDDHIAAVIKGRKSNVMPIRRRDGGVS
jgi:integrase